MLSRRLLPLAAVLVAALVAFLVLRPGKEADPADSPPSTGAATTPARSGSPSKAPARAAAPSPTVIRVRAGKPVGGLARLRAREGQRVRFVVASDVADEVHVHGYDLKRDVTAGGRAAFSFPATITGVFEIELESRGAQLAKLEVRP